MFFKMYRDQRRAEQKLKQRRLEKERNLALNVPILTQDVIAFIDAKAPDFKYIWTGVRSKTHPGNGLEIVKKNNEKIIYDFYEHGFDVSYEGKKRLFEGLAKHYEGNLEEEASTKDVRDNDRVVWNIVLVCHDGLKEQAAKLKKKASIRKC